MTGLVKLRITITPVTLARRANSAATTRRSFGKILLLLGAPINNVETSHKSGYVTIALLEILLGKSLIE